MLRRRGVPRPAHVVALLGTALSATGGHAATLPEDQAEAMVHVYDADGLRASGPAVLVRKKLGASVSLHGSYYIDQVSSASIDVVTTASPFKETRKEYTVGGDYLVRDSILSVSATRSTEPDYAATTLNVDVSQDMFGGMTTVALGYSRGTDDVGRKDVGFFDHARHWRYRLGVTQILSPTWLMSVNAEVVSDDGYLGNPYRSARIGGAFVPENDPRTRSSRAVKFGATGALAPGSAVHGEYRYFWDNWAIRAHTLEGGYSRYFGDRYLAEGTVRLHSQSKALFYSDNAVADTVYLSRNRQLSTFKSLGLGGKLTYSAGKVGDYEVKLSAAYELLHFKYSDFTDLRSGKAYALNAHILQLFASATF
nr:DUF3570 domain-containing protein [Pelomonas sp. P8]